MGLRVSVYLVPVDHSKPLEKALLRKTVYSQTKICSLEVRSVCLNPQVQFPAASKETIWPKLAIVNSVHGLFFQVCIYMPFPSLLS